MSDFRELIKEAETRFNDWYGADDEWTEKGLTGDWSLRDRPEMLSHAIVREDVPNLLAALRSVLDEQDTVKADAWDEGLLVGQDPYGYDTTDNPYRRALTGGEA